MDASKMDDMRSVLEKYALIPQDQWDKISAAFSLLTVEKNYLFVRQGDRPRQLALILSGIFRVYCITESGDEKTLAFRTGGQFLAAYTPFVENRDSWYSIEALTDGELACIPINKYVELSSAHSCWEKIAKEYIVRLFIEKEDRERSFLVEEAKTRYLNFKNKYPELEEKIPQFHIASYLGISPVSLSRIRGGLKKRTINIG